jgi:hypothetical protein
MEAVLIVYLEVDPATGTRLASPCGQNRILSRSRADDAQRTTMRNAP